MSEDVEATIWRLRETIRVAGLAATHRLGQMRRLLMHVKHKTWKREFGFDRIETAAKMDEKRSRTSTSPVPDPFFYRNMVIPRRPHSPDELTLEMKVDVEGLRMEIILSQPASTQCGPSPQRAAIGTGSEEPGASRAPFKTSIDGFLKSKFHKHGAGVCLSSSARRRGRRRERNYCYFTTSRVREEFASLTEERQQQGTTAWATEQNKQFDRSRSY